MGCPQSLGVTAAAARFAFAQNHADSGAQAAEAEAIEKEAVAFVNPLRLPGTSGLYGLMRAADFREVRVVRTELEILPGNRTPFLAYVVEAGGKQFLNPALLTRRGDEMRVRMVNQLNKPTIIHWHGLSIDARNEGNGLVVAEPGKTYLGKVVRIVEFGAFVEIFPGTDGLLHISEIAENRIKEVRDELKEGDQILVKVIGLEGNKIKLSRKAVLREQREKLKPKE